MSTTESNQNMLSEYTENVPGGRNKMIELQSKGEKMKTDDIQDKKALKQSQVEKQTSPLQENQSLFTTRVIHNEVEGEIKLEPIIINIKLQKLNLFLTIAFSIFTLGLFAIPFRFSVSFRYKILYQMCIFEESTHFMMKNRDGKLSINRRFIEINKQGANQIFFFNRFLKYIYDRDQNQFVAQHLPFQKLTQREFLLQFKDGISPEQAETLLTLYGRCFIQIPIPGMFTYLSEVMTEPFFLLQYFTVIVWVLEGFAYFALIMVGGTLISCLFNYYLLRTSMIKLKALAEIIQEIEIFRPPKDQLAQNNAQSLPNGDIAYNQERNHSNSMEQKNKNSKVHDESYIGGIQIDDKEINPPDLQNIKLEQQDLKNQNSNQTVSLPQYQKAHFKKMLSSNLVPGDIFAISNQMQLPCDAVIISGDLLMNEASMTGESIPIPQVPLPTNNELVNQHKDRRYFVFEGTTVMQIKPTFHDKVLCIAVRTGYTSQKGQIFRSVLYPKEVDFAFNRNAIQFLMILAVFVIIAYFALLPKMIDNQISQLLIILRFADAVTWIIPPAMPVFFSICQSIALLRVRSQQILGVNPEQMAVAGKVTHMCFDQTGTLTTNGISVHGLMQVRDEEVITQTNINRNNFSSINIGSTDRTGMNSENPINKQQRKQFCPLTLGNQVNRSIQGSGLLFKMFATCHGAYLIDNEMMGDALDIEMQTFSGWKIEPTTHPSIQFRAVSNESATDVLEVYRLFEFQSELQRMSCVVRDTRSNEYFSFVKGSPQQIYELSIQSTVPDDFNIVLDWFTLKGYRIIGFGYKKLNEADIGGQDARGFVQKDLIFAGFLLLVNQLKPDTADVIKRLKEAEINCKVISGDNPLTTIQTARQANISSIYNFNGLIDAEEFFDENGSHQVVGHNLKLKIIMPQQKLSTINDPFLESLGQKCATTEEVMNIIQTQLLNIQHIEFTITGRALDYFIKRISRGESILRNLKKANLAQQNNNNLIAQNFNQQGQEEEEKKNKEFENIYQLIINQTTVFSRMRPDQKAVIIEEIQQAGYCVGMIGDGANDCSAIKQGDIGISFSDADASFSAPFSYHGTSIDCVEKILLSGRATLVNTIEIFRYYVTVSIYQYMAALILQNEYASLNEFHYTYVNNFSSLPPLFFVTFGPPVEKLTNVLPNDYFPGLENSASMYSQMFFGLCAYIVGYFYLLGQTWYTKVTSLTDNQWTVKGDAVSVMFFVTNILFTISIIGFYISHPFKKRIWLSYGLAIWQLLTAFYNTLIFLSPQSQVSLMDISKSVNDDESFRVNLLFMCLFFCILILIIQECVIKPISKQMSKSSHQ